MTMSRKTGMRGKAIAVICCLALLVGCTGCGALKESSRRERQSQQGQSSQQGERIASSLKDYARSLLDSDGGKISDQQKSALEKAASGGKVSQADYERAWADYKQCIIDKGYAEPTFDKYDNGNPSDGTLALADTMWIPENAVAVDEWTATTGSMVTGGTAIGKIPGALTKLTVKNGAAVGQDRTISMYGVNGILPADSTEITDAEFLRNVSASETFQSMDMQTKKAGLDATVALKEPLQVLRVPAGAVFGIDGSSGCIVPKSHNASNTPAKVTIVGSELGVSLVQTQDADVSAIANVEIGSGLNGLVCK